ncbi:hypothetical protein [Vulcanisaeta distributa]|uniref:hypothetical protein n=1 Tax=Vulcanisaeta distributa TaxID=164451 RepID=UPI000A646021|nr:hypothetical protein [Vulcanisaeta distributa]
MGYLLRNCDFVLTWVNDELRILNNVDIAIDDGLIVNIGTINGGVSSKELIAPVM